MDWTCCSSMFKQTSTALHYSDGSTPLSGSLDFAANLSSEASAAALHVYNINSLETGTLQQYQRVEKEVLPLLLAGNCCRMSL